MEESITLWLRRITLTSSSIIPPTIAKVAVSYLYAIGYRAAFRKISKYQKDFPDTKTRIEVHYITDYSIDNSQLRLRGRSLWTSIISPRRSLVEKCFQICAMYSFFSIFRFIRVLWKHYNREAVSQFVRKFSLVEANIKWENAGRRETVEMLERVFTQARRLL